MQTHLIFTLHTFPLSLHTSIIGERQLQ